MKKRFFITFLFFAFLSICNNNCFAHPNGHHGHHAPHGKFHSMRHHYYSRPIPPPMPRIHPHHLPHIHPMFYYSNSYYPQYNSYYPTGVVINPGHFGASFHISI